EIKHVITRFISDYIEVKVRNQKEIKNITTAATTGMVEKNMLTKYEIIKLKMYMTRQIQQFCEKKYKKLAATELKRTDKFDLKDETINTCLSLYNNHLIEYTDYIKSQAIDTIHQVMQFRE
uniref:hypothetical protein n=1 Tax=Candidatus Ichthyocystis sparus TaxID=1561004 RepID=UPI00159EEE93